MNNNNCGYATTRELHDELDQAVNNIVNINRNNDDLFSDHIYRNEQTTTTMERDLFDDTSLLPVIDISEITTQKSLLQQNNILLDTGSSSSSSSIKIPIARKQLSLEQQQQSPPILSLPQEEEEPEFHNNNNNDDYNADNQQANDDDNESITSNSSILSFQSVSLNVKKQSKSEFKKFFNTIQDRTLLKKIKKVKKI